MDILVLFDPRSSFFFFFFGLVPVRRPHHPHPRSLKQTSRYPSEQCEVVDVEGGLSEASSAGFDACILALGAESRWHS